MIFRARDIGSAVNNGARHRYSRYSYWRASSTFSFAARRAGRIAASTPNTIATIKNVEELAVGDDEHQPLVGQALGDDPAEQQPHDDPEQLRR